jgi:uncharacterized protein YneF (UPF0154 family)
MLAASDFPATVLVIVAILAAGAWGGFWWCRRSSR